MSKRIAEIVLSGGMNNVVLPHMLSSNDAEEIRNLYLDKDGLWKDINNPENILDLSETHLKDAVRVVWWKPTKVPADCIDDFVYVVFKSDGEAKLVYRGTGTPNIKTVSIKAVSVHDGSLHIVKINKITEDINGLKDGYTTLSAGSPLQRKYYEGTTARMNAPKNISEDLMFFRWSDENTGDTISEDTALAIGVLGDITVVAEYIPNPVIRVEDESGNTIAELEPIIVGVEGEETRRYFAGGDWLINDLIIVPPEDFEISLDQTNWISHEGNITISAEIANTEMTEIFVRYNPET